MAGTAAQAFFNPTSPFGTLTGWEVQNDNPTTSQTRAQALGSSGLEIASQLHDAKQSVSATYVATAATAAIPKVGDVLNTYHVDSIAISWSNTAYATMTLTGHKHTGGSTHTSGTSAPRKFTGSITTVGTLFGCPSTPLGVSIPTGAGVRSVNYNLSVNHVDELGSAGNWLAGDNYDPKETVDVELCDTGAITAETGWDLVSVGNTLGNTAAETSSAQVEHHITAAAS